jgi:hypothetical protein
LLDTSQRTIYMKFKKYHWLVFFLPIVSFSTLSRNTINLCDTFYPSICILPEILLTCVTHFIRPFIFYRNTINLCDTFYPSICILAEILLTCVTHFIRAFIFQQKYY